MTQMVSFRFPELTVSSALFWRIVDWCLREGANEFTLSVYAYGLDGLQAAQDRFAQIKELLQSYERSPAKRGRPSGCVWIENEEIPLWMLTVESLEVLKRNRVFNANAKIHKNIERKVEVEDLCLYRDGEPMLAVFKEQHPELSVVLRPDEVNLFKQDHLEFFGPCAPQELWGGSKSFSGETG